LDGKGMWLVMSNGERVAASSTYSGALYRPRGTPFNLINGAPALDTPLQQVGTANFAFSSSNTGIFSYTVNGVTQSKAIQRQIFSTHPTCRFNMANRSAASNFQDLWWNPNESGWGINITHQGSTVFATWFTYDSTRAAMWLVMSNGVQIAPNTFRGELYRTTGTPFSAINGQQAISLPLRSIGSMTLTFSDGLNGTMAYSVDGISGSKAIRRQLFRYPNTVCSQ
jgi:lysyl endopeptidase